MDFAFLPPEINSGRMYDGPGSGSMLAAAAAWDGLAAELHDGNVIRIGVSDWRGAVAGRATARCGRGRPYVAWMRSTASQAEQTAIQAKAAAAAYEVTFAAMVPPPVIAGQPRPVAGAGGDKPVRAKHPGDRCHRDPLRRDVGTRCHREVRLAGTSATATT